MKIPSITFETKCWEKDWEYMLKTNRIKEMISRNRYNFDKRVLIINNVCDFNEVGFYAERLVKNGVLSHYHFVKDYETEVLNHFHLTREDLGKGYVYSISELVGLYLCTTEYLLHFSSDTMLKKKMVWIEAALACLEKNSNCKVVSLIWNNQVHEVKEESSSESEGYYIGQGFSDQMYLVRSRDFKNQIYNETNPESERYPSYGGELFEKRVDSWMRNHGFNRYVCKYGSYMHRNFSKNRLVKKLHLLFNGA